MWDFGLSGKASLLVVNLVMTKQAMKKRTKQFALRVIRLPESLPNERTANVIGHQLLRSGTSVGANYRAAYRARSKAEFVAKLGIVEEETDESLFWMELLVESNIVSEEKLQSLMQEADEIVAIIVSTIKSTRKNNDLGLKPAR